MTVQRVIALLFAVLYATQLHAWKMEADSISVQNTQGDVTTHITFRQPFDTVPLVFALMDDRGGDPSSLRVININTTGFDIYTVEPDPQDGWHTNMAQIPYIAIEPGDHQLPDGTRILAGTVDISNYQAARIGGGTWQTIPYSAFGNTPVVLGQIQTRNNERTDQSVPDAVSRPWITTAIRSVGSTGFDIALDRTKTTQGTVSQTERVAYLVMESGLSGGNHYFGSNNGIKIEYETIRTLNTINGWDDGADTTVNFSKTYHDPIVVATKNTRNGSDGGWLRRGDIAGDHITLQVDEDKPAGSDRHHQVDERAGIVLFSDPFDVEFLPTSNARMLINEVMYNETQTGTNNDEFVELYVTQAGNIEGDILSDQDGHFYRFPSCAVNAGEYVIMHTGGNPTNNSCTGSIKHFYQGVSQYWNNNSGDDVLLLRIASDDVTIDGYGMTFNVSVEDYMAYGLQSASAVDPVPTSMKGTTVTWDTLHNGELDNAGDGVSVALTPNANDSDAAACWEFTASGNASNNSCAGYLPTRDTNNDAGQTNSLTVSNTAMPDMSITKSSMVLSDPVNSTNNPKRIPGATIRYCFTVDDTGDGNAENATIHDTLTGSGKDNLTYIQSGSLVQDIAVVCDCAAISTTNGTLTGSDVTITIGDINGTNDMAHARGCAYIELTIQ